MSQSSKEAGGESPRSALLSILAQTNTEFSIAHVSGYQIRHAQEELNGLVYSLKETSEMLRICYQTWGNEMHWPLMTEILDRIRKNDDLLARLVEKSQ